MSSILSTAELQWRSTATDRSSILLTSNPLNIVDVAIRSGFDGASGIVRAFREHTGVPPADYRKG